MNRLTHPKIKLISALEFTIAAGIVFFWTAFFAVGLIDLDDRRLQEVYMAFESAFPVADALLAVFLMAGGIGLLRQAASGWFFTLMGGAMLLFLGVLDVSFNSRQGIYGLGAGEAAVNIGVNLVCLAGGVFLVWSAWRSGRLRFPGTSGGGLS